MSGRGFSNFVLNNVDQEKENDASSKNLKFAMNYRGKDEDRKRNMKQYVQNMKGAPGYRDTLAAMGLSDSEDEAEVPSMKKLLADIDRRKDPACDVAYIRRVLAVNDSKQVDAVRDFIGASLDQAAPPPPTPGKSETGAAARKSARGDWEKQMAEKARRETQQQLEVPKIKEKGVSAFQRRLEEAAEQKAEKARRDAGNWKKRLEEAAERQAEKLREEEEKRQELVDKGWSFAALMSKDHFARPTALTARGAAAESCNGIFVYQGNHKGKPLFKNENGAIMYFNEFWKMSSSYKVTAWNYAVTTATGPVPPEGSWTSDSSTGPKVTASCPAQRVMAQNEERFMFEDGQTIVKNMENKSWCWVNQE